MPSTLSEALVSPAGPYMISSMGRRILESQLAVGCDSAIWPQPVALEPGFIPVRIPRDCDRMESMPEITYQPPVCPENIVRFQVWISPEYEFRWDRCELFLRHLPSLSRRAAFEITGNNRQIMINFLCHRQDIPVLATAFQGRLGKCKLTTLEESPMESLDPEQWDDIKLRDYYPPPPYYHLFTGPDQLHISSCEYLISALSSIPAPALGIYQVIFQPVSRNNNWYRNIKILMDIEYAVKLADNPMLSPRFPQQLPSSALSQQANHTETKAHNDKPFYAAAVRLGVVGREGNDRSIQSLDAFSGLFQQGGRPLNCLTEKDYLRTLPKKQVRIMFEQALVHRPGFLLNSAELSGLVHIPPVSVFDHCDISFGALEPLASENIKLSQGLPIGICDSAGQESIVCIPDSTRSCHTHLIGRPHMGKSTLQEHMILSDIKSGNGVAVLDPHGDMAERLLALLPKKNIDRVIYFNPADPKWVPIWNPMQPIAGQDIGRTTDDLVGVLKSFVTGWGDRMEHLLRHGIYGLMHIAGTSLQDVSDLLRSGSKESEANRKLILDVIENEAARQFWQHDFLTYNPNEFGPPKHKLSKLLVGGTVSLMLSQPQSKFNFRRIMDDGMIFIGDLSGLGTEVREILGGFIVAILHMTALSRSDTPKERRKAFHIYLDEAHRFVTDSLEDIIAETRKYNVSLTLAHQYLRQFDSRKIDALSSVGTTVVFNVDSADAASLAKGFKKKAKVEDFIDLDVGSAIVRCGTEIIKIQTPEPCRLPKMNYREEIIDYSRRRYYKPVSDVRQTVSQRGQKENHRFSVLNPLLEKMKKTNMREKFYHDRL